jgi:hypothetical protein
MAAFLIPSSGIINFIASSNFAKVSNCFAKLESSNATPSGAKVLIFPVVGSYPNKASSAPYSVLAIVPSFALP